MWLSLILFVLIAGIAIRQAMQGWFSSVITAVLTCCCAAVALGTYEWVAIHWLAPSWQPSYALPIALGATFGVPLVILRFAFDLTIRRSCLLPAWIDRAGGAVSGIISAMTMTGMFALAVQMIPFDNGSILGYVRTPQTDTGKEEQRELFLRPDRFALRVGSMLVSGVFHGEKNLGTQSADLLEAIAWTNTAPGVVSRYAPPRSITVLGNQSIPHVYKMIPGNQRRDEPPQYEPEDPAPGHEFRVIRVKLRNAARDQNKSHIFTLWQFRLVGVERRDDAPVQFHPVAIQQEDAEDPTNRHVRRIQRGKMVKSVMDKAYAPRDKSNEIEIVFELPTGLQPKFLEYKREARAALSFKDAGVFAQQPATGEPEVATASAQPAPAAAPTSRRTPTSRRRASTDQPSKPRKARRRGRVRGVTAKAGASHFGDDLPMTLTSYRALKNAEFKKGALVSGHLVGVVSDQRGGKNQPVSKFAVPQDMRLLQLSSIRLHARSGLGRALNFAVTTLQNYFVEDDRGRRYKIVGKYAVAAVGGQQVIEVQYFSGPTGSIGGLGKFQRIKEKTLKPSDTFSLLFLVEPGARIVRFSTGGSSSREDDLANENLVAPD